MIPVEQMPEDPEHPGKHLNPETGCWPTSEWGQICGKGFVSDARFAQAGEQVIKRKAHKRKRAARSRIEGDVGKPQ
jgi:hypothetical protein